MNGKIDKNKEDKKTIALQQKELQDNLDQHRAMFEKHHCVKLLIDPSDGAISDANEAACAFYGFSLEKMLQMKISDFNTLAPKSMTEKIHGMKPSEKLRLNWVFYPTPNKGTRWYPWSKNQVL